MNLSKARVIGPIENWKRRHAWSSSDMALSRSISARSASRESVAFCSGVLAFHSSQTDWLKPSSIGSPEIVASTPRRMITPPEPRCDKTSATLHCEA